MGRKKRRCPYDDPDCLHCIFDDCYATMQDINRQEAYRNAREIKKQLQERNDKIIQQFIQGKTLKEIEYEQNLSKGVVWKVVYNYKRSLQ